ncbi:hypothetical protein [Massilia sp. CCM 8734]|uniref:hypothetical protein n=1 Tax=Massilia sp. CCM 8734 TaxID=2609283 RepID=UPI00141D9B28|nr:hypothetical protein [Massilia sp. CCM 8734]NHZ99094.1 hypothetical protein [Massilia sp. CCM 8734]
MIEKSNVRFFPVQMTTDRVPPQHLMQPCDFGLLNAIYSLEAQLGSVEAYNRLCDAAHGLKAKIDAGHACTQNPV